MIEPTSESKNSLSKEKKNPAWSQFIILASRSPAVVFWFWLSTSLRLDGERPSGVLFSLVLVSSARPSCAFKPTVWIYKVTPRSQWTLWFCINHNIVMSNQMCKLITLCIHVLQATGSLCLWSMRLLLIWRILHIFYQWVWNRLKRTSIIYSVTCHFKFKIIYPFTS